MKKIIVLLAAFLAFAVAGVAQTTHYDASRVYPGKPIGWTSLTIINTTDTFDFDMTKITGDRGVNYIWGSMLYWTGNDDSLWWRPLFSPDGTNFVLYPGLDTVYTTTAAASMAFDDPDGCAFDYLRFIVTATDTVTINLKLEAKNK